MFDNIKLFIFCTVFFHGIRFKVNEDWVSGIDTLLFFYIYDIGRFFFRLLLPEKRFALFFFHFLHFSLFW